jgi:hypothetical protein
MAITDERGSQREVAARPRRGPEYRRNEPRAKIHVRPASTTAWRLATLDRLACIIASIPPLSVVLTLWLSLSFDQTVVTEPYDLYAALPGSAT